MYYQKVSFTDQVVVIWVSMLGLEGPRESFVQPSSLLSPPTEFTPSENKSHSPVFLLQLTFIFSGCVNKGRSLYLTSLFSQIQEWLP